MGAVVCTSVSFGPTSRTALTMPVDAVSARPCGVPMAITGSPATGGASVRSGNGPGSASGREREQREIVRRIEAGDRGYLELLAARRREQDLPRTSDDVKVRGDDTGRHHEPGTEPDRRAHDDHRLRRPCDDLTHGQVLRWERALLWPPFPARPAAARASRNQTAPGTRRMPPRRRATRAWRDASCPAIEQVYSAGR